MNKKDRCLFGNKEEQLIIYNQRRTINRLEKENKRLKECLDEIDLIFYRMRFVDLNSDKEWIKFINNCINDVRHICQNPINYKKGYESNEKNL